MKSLRIIRTCVALLALYLPAAQAQTQQAQSSGPIAPVGPIRQGADSSAQRQLPVPAARGLTLEPAQDSSQLRADTHTLSSFESLGTGALGVVRNLIDPSFSFSQFGDTGITPGTTSSASSLGVNLSFGRDWGQSHIAGYYGGAQVFYSPNSAYNTAYHNLAVSQEIHRARWVLRLRHDLLLSPEASFGGLDVGGLAVFPGASPLNNLQPSSAGTETILTQRAKRLRNMTLGEVNYFLSRRSIVTLAGSYTSLNFSDPGFIESQSVTGRVGFDYALAPKDAIAFMYEYGRTDFSASPDRLETDSFQFSYGRRVTGRLAFQIAAGPQLLRSSSQDHALTWTLTGATIYRTPRNQYSLSYSHGPTGGSGVFSGASSNTVNASLSRSLTPFWSSSLSAGYAFDKNLAPASGVVSHFSNWYGRASLGREFGRHFRFGLTYAYQRQGAGTGTCPVLVCGSNQSRQSLGMTMEWHPWSISPR